MNFIFGCAGSLLHRLSLVVASRGYSLLWCVSFSCDGAALEHRCTDLVAPQRMESCWTRDRTSVPSIARWILNYWTTIPFIAK